MFVATENEVIHDLLSYSLRTCCAWPSPRVGPTLQRRVYHLETNTVGKERGSPKKRKVSGEGADVSTA